MPRFPADAPRSRVVKALERLGFRMVREREHIAMPRDDADGTATTLTLLAQPAPDQRLDLAVNLHRGGNLTR